MERPVGDDEVVQQPAEATRKPAAPKALIGAAIIVRNEAGHLRRCLGSIRDLCDEIVVVDTGSNDDTVEVARSFGARVLHKQWHDDFAHSRNVALDAVDAEWVLYIDADEEVVNTDVRVIRERLGSAPDVMAFGVQMILRHGWTPYTDFRIWRHHPDIRFRGLIHESSMGDITRIADETGRSLAALEMVLQHHGYEGDQAAKHRRNLPLLRAELERSPNNMNLWNHLGRVYRELGMPDDAEWAWREGISRVRSNGAHSFIDTHVYASLADLMIARGQDPGEILREARTLDRSFHTLTWLEARHHMGTDRPEAAEPLLEELIEIGRVGPEPSGHAYDLEMFDLWPKMALALALFAQCRFDEALKRFEDARSAGADVSTIESHIETCHRALGHQGTPRSAASSGRTVLDDVAIVMAVRVDSARRLRDAVATITRLFDDFDAPIIVGCEQPDALGELVPDGVRVERIEGDPNHPFHGTRAFNELSRLISSPIRVHVEPGVLVPARQILESVRRIRENECDFAVPFDVALVVPGASQPDFLSGALEVSPRHRLRPLAGTPEMGCQVWRTDAFCEVGGENEFVTGQYASDRERMHRVRAFGYTAARISGPCFHLGAGENPMAADAAVHRGLAIRERDRIESLSAVEVRREVSDWPWVHREAFVPPDPVAADDLTVTIPVRIDSMDRLRNLAVCTNALVRATTARILVGIGDPAPLIEMRESGVLHERVEIVAVHDPLDGPFHRTRILNDLARRVTTAFVANLDADVVVPSQQWSSSLELLRSGEAEFVLPYAGQMEAVSHAHHPWLERGDYRALPRVDRTVMHPNSVGGCVVWNTECFMRVGMENEHLVSWGFDDDERLARATILGAIVRRIPGVVYHLDHRRGPDSRADHPHLEANRAVYEAIRSADAHTLAAEVAGWHWAHPWRALGVLVWGDTWHRDNELFPLEEKNLHLTRDRDRFEDADVVVFPLPTLEPDELPVTKGHPDQQWVLLCRESNVNFPLLADTGFRSRFDAVASYELSCDLPMPYVSEADMSRPWPLVPLAERSAAAACAWVSGPWDCSGRGDLMAELMLHMQVDSYGLLLNNTGQRRILDHHRRRDITSRYRFALALENSIATDYVTEKVFEALLVGAVPVYLGAPNIERFLPGDGCIINAADFGSVAELAEYLDEMDDERYMAFHAWRDRPLRADFLEMCARSGSLLSWLRSRCAATP